MANKIINGKQCTIIWHVDDLKISHVDKQVVSEILNALNKEFGVETPLTVTRGTVHEYLGITVEFHPDHSVSFDMRDFTESIIAEIPADLATGPCKTPAANHLFIVNPSATKLTTSQADGYHHLVAKMLYLAKRSRPDIQPTVSFLCTRVKSPDVDDWKKLGRCMRYLRDNKDLKLTLQAKTLETIEWWVDASFAVHHDMRSHTGATVSFGKGSVFSISTKQKLNTRSSTEAELVGVNDAMGLIIWSRRFLEGQGYNITDNVVYQDNQSAMLLENNGKMSSSKNTRHIHIRYFFVTDAIKRNDMSVVYCPTDQMKGDFYTKPLQGSKFLKFRKEVMNLPDAASAVTSGGSQECVGSLGESGSRGSNQQATTNRADVLAAMCTCADDLANTRFEMTACEREADFGNKAECSFS